MVGIYYLTHSDCTLQQSLYAVSQHMDDYGWSLGWRINDTQDSFICHASGPGSNNGLIGAYPTSWVLNTTTMKIEYLATGIAASQILAVVHSINAAY